MREEYRQDVHAAEPTRQATEDESWDALKKAV